MIHFPHTKFFCQWFPTLEVYLFFSLYKHDGCETDVALSELFIFIFFVCRSFYMNYFNFLSKYSLPVF